MNTDNNNNKSMDKTNNFKAIVFDIGNVIFPFDRFKILRNIVAHSRLSEKEIMDRIFEPRLLEEFEKGEISAGKFFAGLKTLLRLQLDYEEFKKIWEDIFTINYEVCEIIKKLHRHYPLAILSNTDVLHFEYLYKNFDIFRYFDNYFLSYHLQLLKPEPEIYKIMIEKIHAPANKIIYIDDIEEYIQQAMAQGIVGIRYQNPAQLVAELSNLGVKEV